MHTSVLLLFVFWLCSLSGLTSGTWDLVPCPGIEPEPPALGAWNLSHWTTGEVPPLGFTTLVYEGCSFLGSLDGKRSACQAGYSGLIPGSGGSPGEGNGNPLNHKKIQESSCTLLNNFCGDWSVFFFFCQGLEEASSQIWSESRGLREVS